MTSCVARVNPDVLGDFFLLDVLFIPVLGVEFALVDFRFRLVLGGRGVSAVRKTRDSCTNADQKYHFNRCFSYMYNTQAWHSKFMS